MPDRDLGWSAAAHTTDTHRTLVIGMRDLPSAYALTTALGVAGLDAETDIGQQGWPAVMTLRVPVADRQRVRRVVLAAARTIDPGSRRLKAPGRRHASVRARAPLAATIPGGTTAPSRHDGLGTQTQ